MAERSGFTLVEVMVAVSLIGLLAIGGGTYLLTHLPDSRVNGATRQLVLDFRLAKTLAVETGYEVYVVFDVDRNEYQVVQDSDHDGTYGASSDAVLKTVHLPESYADVEFYTHPGASGPVTFSGDVATFKPRGTCSSGAVFLRPARDAGVREDRQRRVTVINTARVRATRWNGSDWV